MEPTASSAAKAKLDLFSANHFENLQIAYTVSYGIMFALSIVLLVYLRHNRLTAFKGNMFAARKVILPTFEALFWVVAIVTGAYFWYFLATTSIRYVTPITYSWFTEAVYQGSQFTFLLVTAYLYQSSVSRPALHRSIALAAAVTMTPIIVVHALDTANASNETTFIVTSVIRAFKSMWYVLMLLRPVSRASVRTQREFALFALVFYTSAYVHGVFILMNNVNDASEVMFCNVIWVSFAPFFIWRVLRADTEHWRGFSERACELQQHFRENQGMQEIVSAQGLHVLLEVHRKDIIDFAHMELREPIGVGASANVYRGMLHSTTHVAVKVYSPTEISESTILAFSQEAALCTALKHPNIVFFHGMCISPPSICLVYELCRGSLEDALQKPRAGYVEPLWPKLCYILDAARAVAFLHSFSPPFIHRDIKPANFLLDASNVVKLTDFGEARSMAFTIEDIANDDRSMTVRGTVDYMAPEVIDGKRGVANYTETADIYSLAITMWDILHPGREKYPSSNHNHLNVFRMVLDGQRPPIDPEIPQPLHDLLENCWNADAIFRPSAKMVVTVVQEFLEELCGQVSQRVSGFVCGFESHTHGNRFVAPSAAFTGNELVRCFMEHGYAFETEEAIRFGNALMDAGCLHHTKHTTPFENSTTTTYFFDTQQVDFAAPIQDRVSILGMNEFTSFPTGAHDGPALCPCRKLGQGHVKNRAAVARTTNPFHRPKDDNVLTVNLLHDQCPDDVDFPGFRTSSTGGTLYPSTQRTLVLEVQ
ncbi:TKL protein kinase [Aphanomyces invadans]|uniref:TKL protein kinase n=1 Tax=Aphanomyces invadans TaxID=157072 RepID=A0A024TX83_9STRA|nr:TKL protein kinase [Aphanomyces invadans]ETV98246.1 TKL protein kinase [Aphanomyces invadans]|eukprot:XP_008873121.1 TKL protein kinase [Aphanomyces invadans]